jgi:DNA-binding transcriptional MerR regulator
LKHISIGQFSKLSGLSIRALRLYDAEHLLEPNWVDPSTGYRYYTNAQVERAHLIRQLRACEMPLEQIQTVLHEPAQAGAVMLRHRQHLKSRLQEHQEMLRTLEGLLPTQPVFDAKIRFTSAQPALVIREERSWRHRHGLQGVTKTMGELYSFVLDGGITTGGAPMLTYPCPDDQDSLEVRCCLPIVGHPALSGRIERLELPEAELAYTVHRGSYDTLDDSLVQLLRWVLDQGLEIVGDAREIFLEHPASVSDPRKYQTELAIPIRRAARG